MCYPGILKVRSPELISWLELGSPEQMFAKLCLWSRNLAKSAKLVLKRQDFFQKLEVGSLELVKGLKEWVSGAKKWPEMKTLEGRTSPYYLPM